MVLRTSPLVPVLLLAFATAALAVPEPVSQGPLRVADVVDVELETAHPYPVPEGRDLTLVRSDELVLPGATYVAPYFSRFELAPGDFVVVRSPSGDRQWRYEGLGKGDLGREGGFWGLHVPGERLVVDLYSRGGARAEAWGYAIDRAARGFVPISGRAICGVDDKEEARCREDSDPEIYARSGAVARLLINGAGVCTGWLVGSEGHLMTNNHCIGNATDAMNTDYEFLAEGACGQSCPVLQCAGTIEATSGTLIQTSADLDYSLVQLSPDLAETYGFLQLRTTEPVAEERIYIPQHPGGRGKEIAVVSTHPNDASGFGEIDDSFENSTHTQVLYFADTEGGSSGSPVLAHDDHCVVVLHSGTFGCDHPVVPGNTGTAAADVLTDLGQLAPADSSVSSGPCDAGFGPLFQDGFESGNTSAWSS